MRRLPVLVCFLWATAAPAQTFWTPVQGPFGADVAALHIDATGTIWVGTAEDGLFRSTDGGTTWTTFSDSRLSSSTIEAVGVTSNGTLYAGTVAQGVLRSEDDGATWTAYNDGLSDLRVEALLLTPNDDVLLGTGDGLYTRGETRWQDQSAGLVRRDIRALALSSSGDVLAGVFREGVFRTADLGQGWIPSAQGMEARIIRSIHTDARGHLYVAAWDGRQAYRSTDGGATWTPIGEGLPGRGVWALTTDSTGTLYAGTVGQGVFISTDAGATWDKSTLPDVSVSSVAVHPDGSVWAGSRIGVFQSTDAGLTWHLRGLPRSRVYAFTADDAYHYTSTRFGGLFRSPDAGRTWVPTALQNVIAFALFRTPTGALLAGTRDEGVFRSTDQGDSWNRQGLNFHTIYAIEALDSTLWAATDRGLYQSADDGETWTLQALSGEPVGEFMVDAGGTLHAAIDGTGLMRSTDGGATWTPQQIDRSVAQVWTLHAAASGTVLAGTSGQGIFRWVPGAERWVSVELDGGTVTAFVEDDTGTLWAATWRGEVFISTDDGQSWSPLVDPEGYILRTLYLDADGTLLAGTHTQGVLRREAFVTTATAPPGLPDTPLRTAAYPNPFHRATVLQFSLAEPAPVRVTLYDVRGAVVATLADGFYPAGEHRISWTPKARADGLYLAHLQIGAQSVVEKMIFSKHQ